MSLLLDTHVWIWTQEAPERLGTEASSTLTNPEDSIYVSTISTLEIARLVSNGVIELSGTLPSWVKETLEALMGKTIDVSHEIAIEAYSLPVLFHKDPADRILAATARIHQLQLVTADERLLSYPFVDTLDVRL